MSKKYVIELDDRIKLVTSVGVTENGVVYTTSDYVHNLEELNSDYINEHFGSLQDEAYQKGFEDGKAVNDKGCEGCKYAGKVVTGPPCISCCNSYKNQWTAKDDKIEVGDEVKHDRGLVAVVTQIDGSGLSCVDKSGAVASYSDTSKFRKTGRHFDIDKILEEMKA